MTIWKFPFPVQGVFEISMPRGAKILLVEVQRGQACIWALVDPLAAKEDRSFATVGTGHNLPEGARHVGSFQDGPFVWHVFEPGQQAAAT